MLVSERSQISRDARTGGGVADVELSPEQQALVLRAFGLYFQLANIAEQHHRVRRRREDAHEGRVARDSLERALEVLAEVPEEELDLP